MFYFFLFNFYFITKIYALNENFCVNCKHFISIPFCNDKFGRCKLFPKKIDNNKEIDYLVSGKKKYEYRFCNFVREEEDSCGKEGKYYSEKIFKIPIINKIKNKVCNLKHNFLLNHILQDNDLNNDLKNETSIIINSNSNSNLD
jgi:hypothetical protein